ncbi:MAG TPA: GntG family PLP-dependent aldolase [Candidatus Dormibacteraeota bacterium]|jgi:threonine aldolase|nr:GntG family PLP-dependent aldolase [Candidatus Dormibacteraeota bacterium]
MAEARVDLRSDTFTVPDRAMRRVMADAEVGDDVWGEDPTVRRLEEAVAATLGKDTAMYVPSGTMANLCAVAAQTRPGDEVISDAEAHLVVYEVAGGAVVAGVQFRAVDAAAGVPTAAAVEAAVRTPNIHHPRTSLLALENTHNRRGGLAAPAAAVAEAAGAAHRHGASVHCDGARLFNAAVALDCPAAGLVASCDTVSVCFSKGLGAPVGSALAGPAETIEEARRWRKRLGGGMRQAGIIAAAALHALEHNVDRLAEDHAHARLLVDLLSDLPGVVVVRPQVPTNIVLLRTDAAAAEIAERATAQGVLTSVMDRHLLRCMTYLGIDAGAVRRAARVLRTVLRES